MSAEHNLSRSPVRRDASGNTSPNSSGSNENESMEEAAGSADNSIIGKVKSRVSSIIPSSLSKWFSPSTRHNESVNGSLNTSTTRRRRRIEVEEDDSERDDDDEQNPDEIVEISLGDQAEGDDDGDLIMPELVQNRRNIGRRSLEPPTKRSRPSLDITTTMQLMQHQPLTSSTPAVVSHMRSSIGANYYSPSQKQGMARGTTNHYTHLNLYGHKGTRESGYAFTPPDANILAHETHRDTTNAVEVDGDSLPNEVNQIAGLSSRRVLHLPTSSQSARDSHNNSGLSNLKRHSLASVKHDYGSFSFSGGEAAGEKYSATMPNRTSTTILEVDRGGIGDDVPQQRPVLPERDAAKYNGRPTYTGANKRLKLINGSGKEMKESVAAVAAELGNTDGDSASECSEGAAVGGDEESRENAASQRKTGLFNMSATPNRNGSRTSSIGNGINFYSHLEGRKSLFAGEQKSAYLGGNTLNNSTLSLTSLNRRQFNASIYGSTSALSDSRLLSTFSPFYKGKTTYGGAAAYNKFTTVGSGVGPNAVRITPTLIRPTSSLSTLSSSNNSLAAAGISGGISGEGTSAISSTAKRILDLINDFATPLSEAKKMANNLKTNQQQQQQLLPQAKGKSRLTEADLRASRAMRLSQVHTPYMRPAVTLQPNKNIGMPPVRELQVPSMSQLLQMKKMQSTTERSREIATHTKSSTTHVTATTEYTLPVVSDAEDVKHPQQVQQKHTNKIKSKHSPTRRPTSAKDAAYLTAFEPPPPPANLPSVSFPLMHSVPKFDIPLPILPTASATKAESQFSFSKPEVGKNPLAATATDNKPQEKAKIAFSTINTTTIACSGATTGTTKSLPTSTAPMTFSSSQAAAGNTLKGTGNNNFKFSAPQKVDGLTPAMQSLKPINKNYKFSLPATASFEINNSVSTTSASQGPPAALKTGSVLDALKKPLVLPTSTGTNLQASSNSFGDKFKKSAQQWECDTCLVRNAGEATKCVACETPRTKPKVTPSPELAISSNAPITIPAATLPPLLSSQFKKSPGEWECDTCMIRNKEGASKCVACETPRKAAAPSSAVSSLPPLNNSFGNAFKPKANTWECPTCLINNKNESSECVACQTKKPGGGTVTATSSISSTPSTSSTTFQFGFKPMTASTSSTQVTVTNTKSDEGFKTLAAAQKASKWECEACMTRNDATRQKCVCCEQAKPGTQTVSDNVPKFSFGGTAASKFTFGFGSTNTTLSTANTATTATTTTTTQQKTDVNLGKGGFVFGSTPASASAPASATNSSSGYTFGIKPTTSTVSINATETNKATGSAAAPKASLGFSFGASTTSTTTTSATATLPSVTFSLPNKKKSDEIDSTKTSTEDTSKKPAGGFTLIAPVKTTDPGKLDGQSGKTTETAGGFTLKPPTTTAPTSTANMFSFGAPTTTTSTVSSMNTAAVKPIFSFGTPAAATQATTTAVTSTVTTSTTSNFWSNTSAPSTAGGFTFGNVASSSPAPSISSPFGSATKTAPPVSQSTRSTPNVMVGFGSGNNTSFGIATATKTPAGAGLATPTATTSGTFGSFGATTNTTSTTNSTNIFGQNVGESNKPTASAAPIFGISGSTTSVGATSTTSSTSTTATPFVFGSASSLTNSTNAAASGSNGGVAAANTWSKNSFVFGSAPTNANANTGNAATTSNTNAEVPKPVFGSFGSAQSMPATGTSSSIFGSTVAQQGAVPTFGNTAAAPGAGIFGSTAGTTASTGNAATNLFGSGNSAAAPTFGAPAFGSNSAGASAAPVFGTAAMGAQNTFGGFGAASTGGTGNDGASAAKKSEPAFNFGGNGTQGASGGFNFGANAGASKPAFNFASTSTPAFNFTGATETQAVKPFQFGATPTAPVFNFSGGAVEASPNAPFQFSAGATPASSNIFAPTPASGAQTAQQTRRKIRQPTRRLTPR